LKELTTVILSNNNLQELFIQNSFENLPKLKSLDLSHNKINKVHLAEGIELNLKALSNLNLSFNQFQTVESVN